MSKTKINLKLIIALFGLALVICLVPLGVQALATDEATDATSTSAEDQNDEATVTFTPPASEDANLVVTGGQLSFKVQKGTVLTSPDSVDGIGRMYLSTTNGETLIATCYPSFAKLFDGWSVGGRLTEPNAAQSWTINENTTFGTSFINNPFSDNTGVITGLVATGDASYDIIPVADYKVYFKTHSGEVYETYTDINGHFRLSGIPFYTPGALNGYKEGFVSDYSRTITLDNDGIATPGIDLGTVLISEGVYVDFTSNRSDVPFKVSKWYISVTQPPLTHQFADELDTPLYTGHQFPDNAKFRVLKEDQTINLQSGGTRTFKAGTLVYWFVFQWGVVGGIRYEIYFEPSNEYAFNGWTYTNNSHSNADVPVLSKDDEDNGVVISFDEGNYNFNMNYGEKYQTAQTGDDNLPIVIALIVLACACGGYIAYRKLRKK